MLKAFLRAVLGMIIIVMLIAAIFLVRYCFGTGAYLVVICIIILVMLTIVFYKK